MSKKVYRYNFKLYLYTTKLYENTGPIYFDRYYPYLYTIS